MERASSRIHHEYVQKPSAAAKRSKATMPIARLCIWNQSEERWPARAPTFARSSSRPPLNSFAALAQPRDERRLRQRQLGVLQSCCFPGTWGGIPVQAAKVKNAQAGRRGLVDNPAGPHVPERTSRISSGDRI